MHGYLVRVLMSEPISQEVVTRVTALFRRSLCFGEEELKRKLQEGLVTILGTTSGPWDHLIQVNAMYNDKTPHKRTLLAIIMVPSPAKLDRLMLGAAYKELDSLKEMSAWVVASCLREQGREGELGLPGVLLQEIRAFL